MAVSDVCHAKRAADEYCRRTPLYAQIKALSWLRKAVLDELQRKTVVPEGFPHGPFLLYVLGSYEFLRNLKQRKEFFYSQYIRQQIFELYPYSRRIRIPFAKWELQNSGGAAVFEFFISDVKFFPHDFCYTIQGHHYWMREYMEKIENFIVEFKESDSQYIQNVFDAGQL